MTAATPQRGPGQRPKWTAVARELAPRHKPCRLPRAPGRPVARWLAQAPRLRTVARRAGQSARRSVPPMPTVSAALRSGCSREAVRPFPQSGCLNSRVYSPRNLGCWIALLPLPKGAT